MEKKVYCEDCIHRNVCKRMKSTDGRTCIDYIHKSVISRLDTLSRLCHTLEAESLELAKLKIKLKNNA